MNECGNSFIKGGLSGCQANSGFGSRENGFRGFLENMKGLYGFRENMKGFYCKVLLNLKDSLSTYKYRVDGLA